MNYLLIFLLIGFIPFIYSVYNIPPYPENHQCSVCDKRPLSFKLSLDWPISYYLSNYRNIFEVNGNEFSVTDPLPKYGYNGLINIDYLDHVLNQFKNLSDDNLHERFIIHYFMINPFDCPFHYKICFSPYNWKDDYYNVKDLSEETKNFLNQNWPSLGDQTNLNFWIYEYNKHGSCKFLPEEFFDLARVASENILKKINRIASVYFESNYAEKTPFKFQAEIQRLIDNKRVGIRCIQGLERSLKIFNNQIKTIILCYNYENGNLSHKDCEPYIQSNCKELEGSVLSTFQIDSRGQQFIKLKFRRDIKIKIVQQNQN